MIIHNVAQLSDEWWALRAGVPTASEFKRIITAKDRLPSKGQAGYAAELAADLVCQSPEYFTKKGRPINAHTDYGRDMEEEARQWYAFTNKVEVCQVGFITTDDGRFGCSPDILIKKEGAWSGGVEIKCVQAHKHAGFALKGTLPLEYTAQVHGCLAVTGLPYWDWVAYCPGMTQVVVRVEPNDFTEALKVQMEAFDKLYQEVKAKLGVTKVEEPKDPRVEQAIQAWREKLATGPGIATLNEWLEEMKDLPQASKKPIWESVKAYGATKGWTFDYTEKVWKEPAPV